MHVRKISENNRENGMFSRLFVRLFYKAAAFYAFHEPALEQEIEDKQRQHRDDGARHHHARMVFGGFGGGV